MNTGFDYDVDFKEIELRAREMRANALKNGAKSLSNWVKGLFVSRPQTAHQVS